MANLRVWRCMLMTRLGPLLAGYAHKEQVEDHAQGWCNAPQRARLCLPQGAGRVRVVTCPAAIVNIKQFLVNSKYAGAFPKLQTYRSTHRGASPKVDITFSNAVLTLPVFIARHLIDLMCEQFIYGLIFKQRKIARCWWWGWRGSYNIIVRKTCSEEAYPSHSATHTILDLGTCHTNTSTRVTASVS